MASYALQIPSFTYPEAAPDELFAKVADVAKAAEATGYRSVWVMDHLLQLPPLGGPGAPILEGYMLLAALGAVTERVELGTLVTGVTYRNPAHLAKLVTTLDIISKGRAWLGLGAAWYDVEHEAYGWDYPADRERLDRLEEAVQICRAMFRGEEPTFDGRYYQTKAAKNVPGPIQPGGPRIMVGGGGEKRTLKIVATYADACNVAGTLEEVAHKIEVIHRHCAEVGRDPAEVAITVMTSGFLTTSDEQTASLKQMLEGLGMKGQPVGSAEEIAAHARTLADAGVDLVIYNLPLNQQPEDVATVGDALKSALG